MCSLDPNLISVIKGDNAAISWAKAFVACYEAPGGQINQANVLFGQESGEDSEIRALLDDFQNSRSETSEEVSQVETVAGTIFPESIWKGCKGDRSILFERYRRMIPLIKNCPQNRNGTYFSRLVEFPNPKGDPINQLEHVIQTWDIETHRLSALQAGIFNPVSDHSMARQKGFPCLQQVVFHPHGTNGCNGLSVVAFYATQTILEKAYGNYLGLLRLGRFMSNEMGIPFNGVVCIASSLKLSGKPTPKRECKDLYEKIREIIENANE